METPIGSKRRSSKHFLKLHLNSQLNTEQTMTFCKEIAAICKVVEQIWIPNSYLYATFVIKGQKAATFVANKWKEQSNGYFELHKLGKRRYLVTLLNLEWDITIPDLKEFLQKLASKRGRQIMNFQVGERRVPTNQDEDRYCVLQFNENHEQYRNHVMEHFESVAPNLEPQIWPELDPKFLEELVQVALAEPSKTDIINQIQTTPSLESDAE